MAPEQSYYLHFLQPNEPIPSPGNTDDWGGNHLWKDKQVGRRIDPQLGPEQLQFIRDYAKGEDVSLDEARLEFTKGQAAADCHVEWVFDVVRRAYSSGREVPLPSRLNCMYVFDASLDITAYAAVMRIPLDRTLVKIAPLEGSRVHLVRMSLLGVVGKDDDTIAAAAEQYWDGLSEPELDSEVLLEGPFDVLGVETRR